MNHKIVSLLIVLGLLLTGCNTNQNEIKDNKNNLSPHIKSVDPPAVKDIGVPDQITISRGNTFGHVNDKIYGILTKKGQEEAFTEAIQTAQKLLGELNVIEPDYDVVIRMNSSQQMIHLWLGEAAENGMFAYISDTGTGYRLTKESTVELRRIIKGIIYDSKLAEKNGDIIPNVDNVLNKNRWEAFLQNVKIGQNDSVQVTRYSIEGNPIFYNLDFDGKQVHYQFDATHDAFGTQERHFDVCKEINSKQAEHGTAYHLTGCSSNNNQDNKTFSLLIPNS
ncbi:DUF4362 domain-containing protein [Paenibacillus pini]|uniref:YhfM-like domain-containing protein n=1 Tax=Paenibacillus pini JCM 16418 TaxID=1236976 RepID=W7YUY4_9BACL|nr:DUF4362 domain-containing protein [Paenibacillus pini]GAF08401.1 hypothetical protein JCM16418_2475 [Paenibacillus pini JCM 16418]